MMMIMSLSNPDEEYLKKTWKNAILMLFFDAPCIRRYTTGVLSMYKLYL